MANDLKNLTGTLDISDYRLTLTGVTMNDDSSRATIAYRGIADPASTSGLINYEYSVNNGETWVAMTVSGSTRSLPFVASPGYAGTIIWETLMDLGTLRYNVQFRIRMRATNTVLTSDYAYYSFIITRVQTDLYAARTAAAFPADYAGIPGGDIMKNAPKS